VGVVSTCLQVISSTIFIHFILERYHGGWLAPNIYFLGTAGSVLVNGIRIAGASGIFKPHDFRLGALTVVRNSDGTEIHPISIGHYEKVPYDRSSMRSIYHIREYSVRKLSLVSALPFSLCLS